ncbi:DUF3180 domain-containing protein [Actinomadura sp. HBU206391]|uniref:DUF3180 domain-containing protein n=1 Tax=Actinomadura sp. HBU206391 TaxID=2731692 RepID=UPI00164F0F20|nr:DUF3180 domain-containing protein [Actinomadura sp. HBU206391]MBC6458858.1 DUF3180 domain-containing protein [Actinomadura sp. HBU206391]
MRATRPALLVGLVAGIAVITWVVLRFTYVTLPPLPWTAVPTLLLLGLGEAFTGVNVRARINHKPDTRPVEPLVVARMAALAKASSHAAAVLAGVFGGFLLYLSASLDKATPRHDFFVSGGTFLAAIVLVGAALFMEYACRVPRDPDNEREGGASRS